MSLKRPKLSPLKEVQRLEEEEVACNKEYVKWITYDMPVLEMYIIATRAERKTL